ncbi:hypothetical protein NDU88_000592 [Pleurodeles waltl]|uniref:Uncharacterized protein n=1 Tax=Pleurodeles waltl TaxID=8319 RepID=A0AAV7L7B7_PLEWA|nr:hypothetical protein NDU88_000592 [Pleurodeles waltl]
MAPQNFLGLVALGDWCQRLANGPQSFRGLVALGDWRQRLANGPAELPWTSGSRRLVPALGEWPRKASVD